MRTCILLTIMVLSFVPTVIAEEVCSVSYHLSFDNLDFLAEDWIYQVGTKTAEERKWELVEGRFGKSLYLGGILIRSEFPEEDHEYLLDMVTSLIRYVRPGIVITKGKGLDEPFIWGAGKLHPGCGAVAFWVKGSSEPESRNSSTILFEQTTPGWGRKERELIKVELLRDGTITAYVEDARYVQHTIHSREVWLDNSWNHIIFMWDRSSGVSLWVNGKEESSSMGSDAWWENQRPGLFHFPMTNAAYDEFYIFTRTLSQKEIKDLYRENKPPKDTVRQFAYKPDNLEHLKNAFTTDSSGLPLVRPSDGQALVFREITPERIHDEGPQGWYISDGRYEMAWPHEFSIFTAVPGDVDFHAEKADILPPPGADVNYITFEGNLDGVRVLKGDRNGNFESTPVVTVPETDGFFYGTTVQGLSDAELRIPFTKGYGTPPGFISYGDVLRLPLSGDLRLHEVGLYTVYNDDLNRQSGDKTLYVNPKPMILNGKRYPVAMKALFAAQDRNVAGLYSSFESSPDKTFEIEPMGRLHLISQPAVGKTPYKMIIADIWITSPKDDNVVQFRLRDPAVPSHTWTHAEVKLNGFTGKPSRLRVALSFDPLFLVSGDRLWLEILTTDGLTIVTGDSQHPSMVILRPEIDFFKAEQKFALKTMRPNMMIYSRSFEYNPWDWDKRFPDVDAPENFSGMFDMAYPWQAVLKVNPEDKIANFYKFYAHNILPRSATFNLAKDMDKEFEAPSNAPDWAVYFRDFQIYRNSLITWLRHHQRSDGQFGGGWNDDILIFGHADSNLPLDSNSDALALYNNVYDGIDKTNLLKGGYCRIYPNDRGHVHDFFYCRWNSFLYNFGNPRYATWAMEQAWLCDKPDETPPNYRRDWAYRAMLYGIDLLEWFWGKRRVDEPYRLTNREHLIEELRKAAIAGNDIMRWHSTEAWIHTTDITPYGSRESEQMLFGEIAKVHFYPPDQREDSNITITVGVGWPEGGGPELGRLVEYSGNDGLKVRMYSFDEYNRKVVARLFRIDSGRYRVSLRADNNNDGIFETVVSGSEQHLRRFDKLTLQVPPKVPVFLEITQLKADPFPVDLPDLATSPYYIKKEGNSLVVTVHNIGCAPSRQFTVSVLGPDNNELATQLVESLEDATDYVSKTVDVTFSNLPEYDRYQVRIDRDDTIREIFEENNIVDFIAQSEKK